MRKKGTFDARLESQCRERIKKAVKVMGDLYRENESAHGLFAFQHFKVAVADAMYLSIKDEDMERWFKREG